MTHSWWPRTVPPAARPGKRLRPAVESLEDRLVPATFQVTSALDDGSTGTLRDAITRANNSTASFNTVSFAPGLTGPIVLQSALPALAKSILLNGPGASALTVSRSATAATSFSIFTIPSGVTATLLGLTISGGSAADGGGIHNEGFLDLRDSRVTGNTATDKGGGIYSNPPPAAGPSGPVGVNILNSLIDDNTTAGAGGAAGIDNEAAPLLLQNSTLAGNQSTAGSNAGGLAVNGGSAMVFNSTVAANTATGTAAGGIDVAGTAQVFLQDTIVATNQGSGSEPDVRGNFLTGGYNLIGLLASGADAPGFQNGTAGDQVGATGQPIDPKLGKLQNNGGATPTLALLAGSPAIDTGDPNFTPPPVSDQRGFQRVVQGAAADRIDIGAFEYGATLFGTQLNLSSSAGSATVPANQTLALTVDFQPGVVGATSAMPGGTVEFRADGQLLGQAPVRQGQATLTVSGGLAPGAHQITATYAGDGTFAPNSDRLTLTATAVSTGPGSGTGPAPGGTTPPLPPLTGDVTSHVRIALVLVSRGKKGRSKGFAETLTITNTSGRPLLGPFDVVLRGLRPAVRLHGAAGKVGRKKKSPFIVLNVPGGGLAANASASSLLLFSSRPNPFTLAVFAATPPQ
jgi:hypothetical protein